MALSRNSLRELSLERLEDARTLLAARRWTAAYYFYGLAIELALKACVARTIVAESVPDKTFSQAFYTHGLRPLAGLAGLGAELDERRADSEFAAFWQIVEKWSVERRYTTITEGEARDIADAVENENGVLAWLSNLW